MQQDLFRSINDTTAPALLAGRLIVGSNDPGTCGMHKCELITKHAMGKVARKCNKQVVDSFPGMEMFRSKVRKFTSPIMNITEIKIYAICEVCGDIE